MSLPVRRQPFQSPNDYLESSEEQRAFADTAFATPKTGIVRWFWDRFAGDQVSNRITRARKEQPPPLSQFFNYNGMNIIDGGFSVKKQEACCKGCASTTKPPFSCTLANPQAEGANCPPWHGIPTKEYLYNDYYLCCVSSPFGAEAGEHLKKAKLDRNTLNHARLNVNLDPATRIQTAKAQMKVGHLMDKTNHFVSTRISTS